MLSCPSHSQPTSTQYYSLVKLCSAVLYLAAVAAGEGCARSLRLVSWTLGSIVSWDSIHSTSIVLEGKYADQRQGHLANAHINFILLQQQDLIVKERTLLRRLVRVYSCPIACAVFCFVLFCFVLPCLAFTTLAALKTGPRIHFQTSSASSHYRTSRASTR